MAEPFALLDQGRVELQADGWRTLMGQVPSQVALARAPVDPALHRLPEVQFATEGFDLQPLAPRHVDVLPAGQGAARSVWVGVDLTERQRGLCQGAEGLRCGQQLRGIMGGLGFLQTAGPQPASQLRMARFPGQLPFDEGSGSPQVLMAGQKEIQGGEAFEESSGEHDGIMQ